MVALFQKSGGFLQISSQISNFSSQLRSWATKRTSSKELFWNMKTREEESYLFVNNAAIRKINVVTWIYLFFVGEIFTKTFDGNSIFAYLIFFVRNSILELVSFILSYKSRCLVKWTTTNHGKNKLKVKKCW